METKASQDRERLFDKLTFNSPVEVTDEEVAYFRNHPDEIDDFTAPVNIHKFYLWAGALLGAIFVGFSKALKFSEIASYLSQGFSEFVIDIIFESGVALIGAAVTAFVLEIYLNKQQENAAQWRKEIWRRIGETEEPE